MKGFFSDSFPHLPFFTTPCQHNNFLITSKGKKKDKERKGTMKKGRDAKSLVLDVGGLHNG